MSVATLSVPTRGLPDLGLPLSGEEAPSTTYSVTYAANGATGGAVPEDGSSPYEESATVTVLDNTGSLVRTGYTFAGWNTAADGSGTDYDPDDTFSMPSDDVVLYAQWTINTYTITYDDNEADSGTVPTDENSPYDYQETVTVLGNSGSLVKEGYTFLGWNTAADGSGTAYGEGGEFAMPAANVTLYARWFVLQSGVTSEAVSLATRLAVLF